MNGTQLISRIAPTPSGDIHWGNLWNFALTWAHVRQNRGKLWLRFDDIDRERCSSVYAENTRTVLRHLGLHWDEEYSNQIQRIEEYRSFLKELPHYVCNCSRQDIWQRTGAHHYDGNCRELGHNFIRKESTIRFLHPDGPAGDFVLWRKEDIPSYHLTSILDDQRMGVNLIVRGEDLRESTELQKVLSTCLPGDPLFKVHFIHHPILLSSAGEKLSKSRGHGELQELLNKGVASKDIYRELSKRVGLSSPISSVKDLQLILR